MFGEPEGLLAQRWLVRGFDEWLGRWVAAGGGAAGGGADGGGAAAGGGEGGGREAGGLDGGGAGAGRQTPPPPGLETGGGGRLTLPEGPGGLT